MYRILVLANYDFLTARGFIDKRQPVNCTWIFAAVIVLADVAWNECINKPF